MGQYPNLSFHFSWSKPTLYKVRAQAKRLQFCLIYCGPMEIFDMQFVREPENLMFWAQLGPPIESLYIQIFNTQLQIQPLRCALVLSIHNVFFRFREIFLSNPHSTFPECHQTSFCADRLVTDGMKLNLKNFLGNSRMQYENEGRYSCFRLNNTSTYTFFALLNGSIIIFRGRFNKWESSLNKIDQNLSTFRPMSLS